MHSVQKKNTRRDNRRLSTILTSSEAKQKKRFDFGLSVLWQVSLKLPTAGGAATWLMGYIYIYIHPVGG